VALREIGLRDATDREIFLAARRDGATIVTKDGDFSRLLETLGPPPQVIWITCGNTSNAHLKQVLTNTLPRALEFLESGETLVEVSWWIFVNAEVDVRTRETIKAELDRVPEDRLKELHEVVKLYSRRGIKTNPR
jgi:predicted nuclease of predicted toxin-antitoxin system